MIEEHESAAAAVAADAARPTAASTDVALVGNSHVVQFYEDDGFLYDTVARFIGAGLAAGEGVVIIATELHRHGFRQRLADNDFDVDRAIDSGRLRFVDAAETLERLLVGGAPDRQRVEEVLGSLVRGAAAGRSRVRIYGEMVDLLWRDGRRAAALGLEVMWNELVRQHDFSLSCAYVMGHFYRESHTPDFARAGHVHALEAEVERLKLAEERLAQLMVADNGRSDANDDRFRLIVESVSDYAIFMLDAGGHVSSWNRGAERIKGWRAEEIVGAHFSRFYPDEEVRAGKCEYELDVAARDGRFEDEGWRVRKDGSRFWANVIISRIVDRETGKLLGFAKVTRDLSQRRALELEKVARAAAEAELAARRQADNVRERLLGVVGHDLRAPLSAISMAAGVMLKRGALEGSDVKMAARIARNADRMAKMISQLLDFTRARLGGGIPIEPKPVDLGEVCGEILGDSEIAHPDRTFELAVSGDTRGVWDRERLAQVVANLVGNAAKYGDASAPITVALDGAGDAVRLRVHNAGPPIPSDVLPSIFDPFRRGNDHRERSESLGLGLYIVSEIVRAHGGTIDAASSAEEGTTFTVALPRTAPARRADDGASGR